ncbi:hypothetical protein [Mesorhizobium sp. 113-3-3]|uniref:hypothetical protein n=1 Tax=Mesorhizobium sp. 113-3-3 TaxID=2744516 RepID=UPI001925634C|nr:hypothetical protein [Mesorhizobium sp. 113-3-3]BCG80101.1 hypothetical protein MesoLj113b_36430 [Mesorhizobium sp. 113-3-3]
MIIVGEYHAKNAADLDVGELICFDLGRGRLYGVRTVFGSKPAIVVLKSEESGSQGSHLLNPGTVGGCLSFGANWVLEPVLGTELPPGEGCRIPGTLAIHNEGIHVITKISAGNSIAAINLAGESGTSDALAYGAFFREWRIWRTEAEMGGTPIVSMEQKSPPP